MVTMKHLRHLEIDKNRWDAFLENSPQRLAYGFTGYLDCISPNWEALIFEENGIWRSIVPIPVRKRFGIRFISQPYFCQQLGFFADTEIIDAGFVSEAIKYLKKQFDYCPRLFWNLPNLPESKVAFTHLLNLSQNYSAVYEGYSTYIKRNLQKAQQVNWTLEICEDIKALIRLHQAHNEEKAAGRKLDFDVYQPYIEGVQILFQLRKAIIIFAKKEGKIEAGGLFVMDAGRIIYLFNGASPIGRQDHGRLLIIDSLIQKYAGQPFIFDFEDPLDAPSVSAYYASFGAKKSYYSALKWQQNKFLGLGLKTRRLFR